MQCRSGAMKEKRLILVVDDSRTMIAVVKIYLGSRNYEFMEAGNVDDAMQIVRKRIPDLIISDICMPGKSGIDFCYEVRADPNPDLANVPVLLMTSTKDEKLSAAAKMIDGCALLAKPFTTVELCDAATKLLG
jgi:CheY-like chemotaxis protein